MHRQTEEILSSDSFTANDTLWTRTRSSDDRVFRRDRKNNEGSGFDARPLSYLAVEEKSIEYSVAEEVVLVEQEQPGQLAAEDAAIEPAEPLVSFTESEYQAQIRDKVAEAESALRNELEAEFRNQVEHLSSQQSVFFEKVIDALRDENLTSEIVAIALKIGSLLARAQLRLDESVVADFVDTSLKRLELQDSKTVSVQMSKDWEGFLEALNDCRPEGYEFTYEETLRPGDMVVTAGDSGYFDFFHARQQVGVHHLPPAPPGATIAQLRTHRETTVELMWASYSHQKDKDGLLKKNKKKILKIPRESWTTLL